MDRELLLRRLERPKGKVRLVLDTDTYNEIDDQFAVSYALLSPEKIELLGLYAAPFHNERSDGPEDGMERSYDEILKLLRLAGREDMIPRVFKGSRAYLPDEKTPVPSPAAEDLIRLAKGSEEPLYVLAIGAITNVASALLMAPEIADRIVIVWLGGNAWHLPKAPEFNMMQDIAAARVVFASGTPLVQLPCAGVVDHCLTSKPELEYWLKGVNPLADYLAQNTIDAAESYASGRPWTRVIWDITTVAWILDTDRKIMQDLILHRPAPEYDHGYGIDDRAPFMAYVYSVNRDALFDDLFRRLRQA